MDINNMEKMPETARKKITGFVGDMVKLYGDEIISIFVYGSATSPDYDAKRSDINLGIVLKDLSVENLKRSLRLVRSGVKRGITAPLFLDMEYINSSLDTFPMEFMNMKDTNLVLHGKNVLSAITVKDGDLRRECEYQIKGKLLTLRQAYLEQALDRRGMEHLLKSALKALMPVFTNMLRLKKKNAPPASKPDVLREMGETFALDMSDFFKVLEDKKTDGRISGRPAEECLDSFIDSLQKLSIMVEDMGTAS